MDCIIDIFENEKVLKFYFHTFLSKFRPFIFCLDLDSSHPLFKFTYKCIT